MQLISKDDFIDRLTVLAYQNRELNPDYADFCDDMTDMLEDTPFWNESDFADVVRCGQCQYWRRVTGKCTATIWNTYSMFCPETKATDFCSFGKVR